MKSECLVAVAAVLLSSQPVVAEPEHGGRGGSGGHGGGFGFHGRRGGFFGGRPYGPPMYPYPPPMLPYPAPLPMAPVGGLPIGGGVPVGVPGAAARFSMPGYPFLDGLDGIGPMFDDSFSGYDFSDWWGKNRNLAASQAGQAGQAGAFTAQASANVQVGSADQEPMGFVAQPRSFVGQVTSNRFNVASSLGGSAGRSARMLNQGTEGLQIEVDGQGAMLGQPQGQMPPPPMQQPAPMPPQPSMQPPQPQGGLVTKGFVRKAESYQEQKSGSKQSSKEYEKTTTPI